MRKVLITESSLRDLLRELMNSHAPIFPNPVVDPQAAETDPTNQNFVPSDKVELMSALRALVDPVDDERIPQVYVAVKDAIEKEESEMKDTKVEAIVRQTVRNILKESLPVSPPPHMPTPKGISTQQAFSKDEVLRDIILNFDPKTSKVSLLKKVSSELKKRGIKNDSEMLAQSLINSILEPGIEIAKEKFLQTRSVSKLPQTKSSSYGPGNPAWEKANAQQRSSLKKMSLGDLEDQEVSLDEPAPGRTRRNVSTSDVGGEGLKELAKEFGFANPNGVLQWINKVLQSFKARFENPDVVKEVVLETVEEWLDRKIEEGEFAQEEVDEWKEPGNENALKQILDVIQDDRGFREMLSPKIAAALKAKEKNKKVEEV
jgi:hypothetical protein